MTIHCPACDAPNSEDSKSCLECGVLTRIDGRFVLCSAAAAAAGEDVVDRAASLRVGRDLDNGREVSVRIAPIGMKARLVRESTILKGLHDASVPSVLASASLEGAGSALILTAPPFPTLEAQVADGLRIDDERARALIGALLNGLAALHRVSPPVFHRNLHPGTVAWDGANAVHFLDFARATDIVEDAENDLVAARAGYTPHEAPPPAQQDLYGLGATVAHVLSRRAMTDLPRKKNGAPDIRPAIVVSDHVETFLEALLSPNAVGAPKSLEDAQNLWREKTAPHTPPRSVGPSTAPSTAPARGAAISAVLAVVLAGAGAAGFFVIGAGDPEPIPRPHPALAATPPAAGVTWRAPDRPTRGTSTPTKKAAPTPPARTTKRPKSSKRRALPPAAPSPAATFQKKLAGAKTALMTCDDPANERIRLKVQLNEDGRVDGVTEVGRTRGNGAACVRGVVKKLSIPSARVSKKVTLDVWVWTHPKFKTKVF